MKRKINWPALITALLIPLAVGGISAFLTKDNMIMFEYVKKPPLAPPSWLFPVAWTALYIMMGLASYLVYVSGASEPRRERALTVYAVQLVLNFFWTIIFFNLELFLASFIWLVLLWLAILICMALFAYISAPALWLMLPYLLWVSFAGYLNLGIYLLN